MSFGSSMAKLALLIVCATALNALSPAAALAKLPKQPPVPKEGLICKTDNDCMKIHGPGCCPYTAVNKSFGSKNKYRYLPDTCVGTQVVCTLDLKPVCVNNQCQVAEEEKKKPL